MTSSAPKLEIPVASTRNLDLHLAPQISNRAPRRQRLRAAAKRTRYDFYGMKPLEQSLNQLQMRSPTNPPANYTTPRFPSLNVKDLSDPTTDKRYTLFYIEDVWYFTVLWTLIMFWAFHLGAVLIAFFTHGWNKSSWKYLWAVPVIYMVMAGLEALLAGTVVGLM